MTTSLTHQVSDCCSRPWSLSGSHIVTLRQARAYREQVSIVTGFATPRLPAPPIVPEYSPPVPMWNASKTASPPEQCLSSSPLLPEVTVQSDFFDEAVTALSYAGSWNTDACTPTSCRDTAPDIGRDDPLDAVELNPATPRTSTRNTPLGLGMGPVPRQRQYSRITGRERSRSTRTRARRQPGLAVEREEAASDAETLPRPKEIRRKRVLERNRIAATKCRLRKRDEASALDGREQELQKQNQYLKMYAEGLKSQVLDLRTQLLGHTHCNCVLIQQYIADQARKSVGGAQQNNALLLPLRQSSGSEFVGSSNASSVDISQVPTPPTDMQWTNPNPFERAFHETKATDIQWNPNFVFPMGGLPPDSTPSNTGSSMVPQRSDLNAPMATRQPLPMTPMNWGAQEPSIDGMFDEAESIWFSPATRRG